MLLHGGLKSLLLLASVVSADVARVFLSGHSESQAEPRTLSPSDARLVIARRLGLSDFHSLRDANDATIEALNLLSGKPQPLFNGNNQVDPVPKAIFVVEGGEDVFGARVQRFDSSRQ